MTSNSLENKLNSLSSNYSENQLDSAMQQMQINTQQMSGQDTSGLNSIYANLSKQLSCDSECQKRMNIDELRKKWKAAKLSQTNAPNVTLDAEKDYLVASEGIDGYHNTMLERYTGVANSTQQKVMQSHNEIMKEIIALNDNYSTQTNSLTRIKELLNIKLNENSSLLEQIDQVTASVQTNDRKVVYEEWAKTWLITVRYILRWIYILIVLVFIYKSPFVSNSTWKTLKGWFLPISLLLFPFTIYYIALIILFVYNKILWFLENKAPKNVYSQL